MNPNPDLRFGMNMHKLLASISKEAKIIIRDREALLLLFVMPLAFVLIMSLAMRDAFKEKGGVIFPIVILDMDGGQVGREIINAFSNTKYFRVDTSPNNEERVREDIARGNHKFAVIIPAETTQKAVRRAKAQMGTTNYKQAGALSIRLMADPTIQAVHRSIVISSLNRILQGIETKMLIEQFAAIAEEAAGININIQQGEAAKIIRIFSEVTDEYTGSAGGNAMPTSVQQSVPAWSLFAMFFLVIPLSVAFIKEKQQGSLLRLKSMPVPAWVVLAGKMIPYFVINQLQFVFMMLVGMYLLPFLGGDALEIGNGPGGIALLTISASFAAIGYGLLIATFCKTSEQATTMGGTSVIIFGAIGGIMVPKFVMPSFMQKLTVISPMSWGLEGFVDIFVRGGNINNVLPEASMLFLFATVCFSIAALRFRFMFR